MSQDGENELSTYVKQIKSFQTSFLNYYSKDSEEDFESLSNFFEDQKISENKQKFITLLCFISKFTKNYHRSTNFISKTKKILSYFRPFYNQHLTNIEIFNLFKKNKLVLLLLFNEKILIPDAEIYSIITTEPYQNINYPQYFYKEFQSFHLEDESTFHPDEDYDKNREVGQNDSFLSKMIRNDEVKEFITYVNKTNLSLNSHISSSIYETNPFLLKKKVTLFEYALFYGSVQIITYMLYNKATFSESSWLYSVHSKNGDLIHLLEYKNIKPKKGHFDEVLHECIKCHHNEIAEYILNNKMTKEEENNKKSISIKAIHDHNYFYIQNDYNFLTESPEILVLMTKERYYELFYILITMRVGPGILCSCIEATFGQNKIYNLFYAVQNHDIEMVKVLMSSSTFNTYGLSTIVHERVDGVDNNNKYESMNSKTSLFLAVERKYYDIVELLLSDEKCNINQESSLEISNVGYLEISKIIYTKYPIHAAIENGDAKMLELLLKAPHIDVNIEYKYSRDTDRSYCYNLKQFEKKTPLQLAIEKEDFNAVRLLLSHKSIDVNKMLSFKLDKKLDGFEYDEDDQGNEEEERKDDNERNKRQRIKKTALHLAVEKGNIEIIQLLLKHSKIDINSREKYVFIKPLLKIDLQKTALQIAIEKKDIDIVKLLLNQKSISINERIPYKIDREPRTCPVYDDDGNEIDKTEENKKAVKHIDCLKTPLHVAAQIGCIEIIKLLLEHRSIELMIDDGQGKLPIDYTENPEIKKLLA